MKTVTSIDTKASKDATEATTTNLTIDWEGMTEEDLRALAQQALIVKLQSKLRKDDSIPTDLEVKAVDYKVGVRAPRGPVDVAALAGKLDEDGKRALIEKLMASLKG